MYFSKHAFLKSAKVGSTVVAAYHVVGRISHADNVETTNLHAMKSAAGDVDQLASSRIRVDSFDCPQPACASKLDLFKEAFKRQKSRAAAIKGEVLGKEGSTTIKDSLEQPLSAASTVMSGDDTNSGQAPSDQLAIGSENEDDGYPSMKHAINCPLDREELGRSTWDLIHTVAAYYPDVPSDIDKTNADNFIKSLAYLYPCEICRDDFKESVSKNPPL